MFFRPDPTLIDYQHFRNNVCGETTHYISNPPLMYVFSNYRICPKSAPLNRLWSIPSPINTCVGSKAPIEVDVWWAAKMRHPVNGAGKWHS